MILATAKAPSGLNQQLLLSSRCPASLFRAFSSAPEAPVGSYTPVTTKLWIERLEKGAAAAQAGQTDGWTSPGKSKTLAYSFSSDPVLKELYRNPWNKIRIGRVMEDLDSLAGSVAFEHCHSGTQPPLLVTASVDEISLQHPISIDQDVTLQGSVVWTGSSSLDIQVTLNQPQYTQPSLKALFSFVNLDPSTRKAAPVRALDPKMLPGARAELYAERQQVADERKRARQAAAAAGSVTVSAAARAFMAPLLAEHRRYKELPALVAASPGAVVPQPATSLQNTFVCQPQQRNTHGRIFGGFLMRRAYELAFATTYTHAGTRPAFAKCDEITFKRPVDVGDLLRFRSHVVHTAMLSARKGVVYVDVEATVAKPEKVDLSLTNNFSFAFTVDCPEGKTLARVLPTSEEEALRAWECQQDLSHGGFLMGVTTA